MCGAGMIPGVIPARRRRFRISKSNNNGDSTNRPASFCLHATNYYYQKSNIKSSSSMERKPLMRTGLDDEKLDAAVREAKIRLDHRLHDHWKQSETIRKSTMLQNLRKSKKRLRGRLRSSFMEGSQNTQAKGHPRANMRCL